MVDEEAPARVPWVVSRRMFLKGSASALALGLAACNGATTTTTTRPGTTTTTTEGPPGSTTTTTTEPPTTTTTTMPASPGPGTGLPDLASVAETWADPWVWRPTDDADDILNLYVVENFATIQIAGGNLQNGSLEGGTPLLFSWNGVTPGPTIRMRGDQTLRLKLYNQLGPDDGVTPVGPNPDPQRGSGPYPGLEGSSIKKEFVAGRGNIYGTGDCLIPADVREDWCLGEHVNGVHTVHVTNIHTHGLHVRPAQNPNGTHSDNIYLRVIPRGDARRGIAEFGTLDAYIEACFPTDEVLVGEANYEFELGRTEQVPVHPPGTHWYHPHSHGGTHQQVAGGMAGFFVVEGDVDDTLNDALTGETDIDPEVPTGPWNYRERTVLIQRISVPAIDPDAPVGVAPKQDVTTFPVVNGSFEPRIIVMQPGAVERWRVLNGSVDGGGFFRVALLKGAYVVSSGKLVDADTGTEVVTTDYQPVTLAGQTENLKQPLWQFAWDGITLVDEDGNYFVKNLDQGSDPDLGSDSDCYASAENVRSCYVRPNEVRMTTGNRTDLIYQAPALAESGTPEIYTLVGLPTGLHGNPSSPILAAYVILRGDPVAGGTERLPFDEVPGLAGLVPPYLKPITPDEPGFQTPGGGFRTRTVRYAGWGSGNYPHTVAPDEFVAANPELSKLIYYVAPQQVTCRDATQTNPRQWWPVGEPGQTDIPVDETTDLPTLVVPPLTRTMNIDGFKFNPTSVETPRMELDSTEEWAVFNQSIELYGPKADSKWTVDDLKAMKQAGTLPRELTYYVYDEQPDPQLYFPGRQVVYPLHAADAPEDYSLITAAVDHPFHIHQNPFRLMTLDVPLADGTLVNVLPEPRWGDTQWIPRNGGRFVFRSRFWDYTGELVNHCHILLHEDNGMMQRIQIGPPYENPPQAPPIPQEPNYVVAQDVLSPSGDNADQLYPPPTPDESYVQSAQFVDTGRPLVNPPGNTGQVFPGFPVEAPTPPSS